MKAHTYSLPDDSATVKAVRPDIAHWSIDTELLAVIAEATAGVKVKRPGAVMLPAISDPDAITAPVSQPGEAPAMSSPEDVRAFFGGSVRYVAPKG